MNNKNNGSEENNSQLIAASRIQSYWREYKAINLLNELGAFELEKKGNTILFDDFTKIMLDANIVDVAGRLIYSIQCRLRLDLKINNRVLLTAYLFSKYPNQILGDEDKRDGLSSQIHFYSKLLTKSLIYDINDKKSRFSIIDTIGKNMLNFSLTFSVWKLRDKSHMIQNMMLCYYQKQVHIEKIKSGELSTDESQKEDSITELESQQNDLLDSIKILDKKFDIDYFKNNYVKIYETMEDDYSKLQNALKNNMKIAYFDYIKEGMENGDYNPLIALITEIRQRLLNVMSAKLKEVLKKNINIDDINDKISHNSLEKEDIVKIIIHIVNAIGSLQAPIHDNTHDEWREELAKQLSDSEEDFNELVPEILIQAEEKIDRLYADIMSLTAK